MSDAILDLLAELRAVGLVLAREGNRRLRVRPSSKLSEARRQAILLHKRDLIAALDAERMAGELIERAAGRGKKQECSDSLAVAGGRSTVARNAVREPRSPARPPSQFPGRKRSLGE